MVHIHKKSRQRFSRARHSGDFAIEPKGPEAISQESVPVIGGWKDFIGSGGVSTKSLMFTPSRDELFGTDAWIEGARNIETDVLGNSTTTRRLRQKIEIIDFKDC